jgi:two-component system response regulator FixJ
MPMHCLLAVQVGLRSVDDEARDLRNAEIKERMATLSASERQVLDAVVAGHTSEIVAEQLGISKRAAEVHRANIMTKLQAESLSHLLRMVLIAST